MLNILWLVPVFLFHILNFLNESENHVPARGHRGFKIKRKFCVLMRYSFFLFDKIRRRMLVLEVQFFRFIIQLFEVL